jgi:uncharacterized protein involved in exopolysaccharide biosynthesis
MEKQLEFKDINRFFNRRKKSLLITFFMIFLLGVSLAMILPPVFLSKATILIEEQQIPESYVETGITGYVEERLEMITQRILNRPTLLKIVDEYNLYSKMKDRYTTEEILEKFKNSIILENINAEIQSKRTGRSVASAVAFSIAYEGHDPISTQKVTEKLASLYLEEETKTRESRSNVTTEFLNNELENIKKQIQVYENRISKFKRSHIGELPENTGVNVQIVDRLERDLDRINTRLRELEERKISLQGQLAEVDPLKPVIIDGEKVATNPKERLKSLYIELIRLQATLSEKHPDVKKLKREISELEAQIGKSDASVAKIKRLNELKVQLAELQGKYGPNHPDVIKLSNEVNLLSMEVDRTIADERIEKTSMEKPDNPAYIQLLTRIKACDAEINSLIQEKDNKINDIKIYQRKIDNSPIVEKEYNELRRGYDNAQRKYDEIYNKLMQAKVAQGMEASDKSEHFILKSPAYLPEKPYKPNRGAIILISMLVAMVLGITLALTKESLDNTIRSVDEIKSITKLPVLTSVSLIVTKEEKSAKRVRLLLWSLAVIIAIGVALILIDQYVMKMDIILTKLNEVWKILLERLTMIS